MFVQESLAIALPKVPIALVKGGAQVGVQWFSTRSSAVAQHLL